MVFTTTRVLLHNATTPKRFNDDVIDGKFYNFGVQAYSALKAHKTIDIHSPAEGDYPAEELIIPYHAVMVWNVTKEEGEYTKPEDDFCKSESTPTGGITLLDGTYEFEGDVGKSTYTTFLEKCYDPANVTVTVDGTTATLPRIREGEPLYGEDDGTFPVFTTYPAYVAFEGEPEGGAFTVVVPTVGSHTVKVTIPSGSEVECPQGD